MIIPTILCNRYRAAQLQITFQRLTEEDLPTLAEWLKRPHVADWWDSCLSIDETREKYLALLASDSTVVPYFAYLDGIPIGYIQSYVAVAAGDGWWPDEHDPGVRGIDQFLAESRRLGQGIGTSMVIAFVELLFSDPRITRIQADPSPSNAVLFVAMRRPAFVASVPSPRPTVPPFSCSLTVPVRAEIASITASHKRFPTNVKPAFRSFAHLLSDAGATRISLSLGTQLGTGTVQVACYPFAMQQRPGIYVEILIDGDIEKVWKHTQRPELHEPWDLRFTEIQYLPRASEAAPQQFNYTTRIGFGLKIVGRGESTGNCEEATGVRTSALKFWSADMKSLIEEGSGYWQYIPTKNGVRFLTWYDYRTRFGAIGRLLDRTLFSPLLGWATAWSFDRLRLWIDKGLEPKVALRLATIHACSRLAIAIIWLWQGLLPKLLFNDADERAMIAASHLSTALVPMIGLIEIAIAACTILSWRRRSFFLVNIVAMVVALANVAITSPSYLVAAFNPVTLNLAMIALSLVGYVAAAETPSASRCLRQPPKESI